MTIIDSTNTQDLLITHFDTIADAPSGIARLRKLVLQLAMQGKLVEQDPSDEPASTLLERVRLERSRLVEDGLIDRSRIVTDIEREEMPFVIPSNWIWVRISEIGHDWGQKVPNAQFTYIDVSTVDNKRGVISEKAAVVEPADAPSRARKIVKNGTVIYGTVRPYLLNIAIVDREFTPEPIASTAFAIVHPYDGIYNRYILHYFRSSPFIDYVASQMKGMAYPAINDNQFFNGLLPLPPLAEQRRIVERVDQLMALCDTLEAQQARQSEERQRLLTALINDLLDAHDAREAEAAWARLRDSFDLVFNTPESVAPLRQAVLQLAVQGRLVEQDEADEPASVLLEQVRKVRQPVIKDLPKIDGGVPPFKLPSGWTWTRFPEIGEFGRGKSKHRPRNDTVLYSDGKYPLIQTGDVSRSQGIITTYTGLYNDIGLAQSRMWPRGTLCITIAANIADSGILDFDSCFPDSVVGFIPSSEIGDAKFFEYFMRTAKAHLKTYAPATAQQNINLGILEQVLIPLPPLVEQRRIVERVDELMTLCDTLEAKLREERTAAKHLSDALCQAIAAEQPNVLTTAVEEVNDDLFLELPPRRRSARVIPPVEAEAILLAYAHQQHLGTPRESTLGHVKAEKTAHLVEALTRLDLERQPVRMPRGPADAAQLQRAIAIARDWGAFDVSRREDADWGYRFIPGPNLAVVAARFTEVFTEQSELAAHIVALLVPLRTRSAEAVATLYAVWNDLLRNGEEPDDEHIFAAFWEFHSTKEHFKPEMLVRWLAWMRDHDIVPDGGAKPTLAVSEN